MEDLISNRLLKPIVELELSVRSINCLSNMKIENIGDLVQKTEQEMLRIKNFGRKSLNELKEILADLSLCFREVEEKKLEVKDVEIIRLLLLEKIGACYPCEYRESMRKTLRKLPPPGSRYGIVIHRE